MTEEEVYEHLDVKALEFMKLFPPCVRFWLEGNFYFAGGCIRSLLKGETPNDYDIFIADHTLIDDLVAAGEWSGIWVFISNYACSRGKFQMVTKFAGNAVFNIREFDFKHNMYWYYPFTSKVHSYFEDDFEYALSDELVFNDLRPREVERVFVRIPKFKKRGMKIKLKEVLKILKRCKIKELIHQIRLQRDKKKMKEAERISHGGDCY